ncbi:TIGR03620 family F420-dependent LLM class oxidoreductase [Symbioplanes lichenis]|uniref:TIGR03620 family F420-dependent LLM class oxidoreductase n=1 Tax=Symbioplanes lichenis TaxID=1629072 RepID=UPI00273989C1|nr:TIGR03620 family F420-dependent LLM class oxidoreductase [Actinoplanes lichenis]
MTNLGGQYGVWRRGRDTDAAFAQAVEGLGYSSLWLGGVTDDDLERTGELLAATTKLVVATGIVNIFTIDAATAAGWFQRVDGQYPGRVVLGVGTGHREAVGPQAATPYQALVAYLDELQQAGIPAERIVIAALGPRVLKLSRDRTGGAHPYLTTPEHTRTARAALGPDKLLVPEQHVALGDKAAVAREAVAPYLQLTNYRNNWLRSGFTEQDLADGGSDAFLDAVVALGTPDAVAARLRAHLDAGADQVLAQALGDSPLDDLTDLAQALPFQKA